MATRDIDVELQSALRIFNYDDFREGQLEASRAILRGKDVFVRMKTSGGKSLCYLVPALVMPGSCIVVSPLISLMDDQVLHNEIVLTIAMSNSSCSR